MEPYLNGDMISEAALIMSYDSKYDVHQPPASPDHAGRSHPQLDAQIGMARVLKEMSMLFTVLPSNRLEKLEGKKIAFLTNATSLRESEMDILCRYVEQGGNLYLSGTTDPHLAKRLLGLNFLGYTRENPNLSVSHGSRNRCLWRRIQRPVSVGFSRETDADGKSRRTSRTCHHHPPLYRSGRYAAFRFDPLKPSWNSHPVSGCCFWALGKGGP